MKKQRWRPRPVYEADIDRCPPIEIRKARCPYHRPGDIMQCQRERHSVKEPHEARRASTSLIEPLGLVTWEANWLPKYRATLEKARVRPPPQIRLRWWQQTTAEKDRRLTISEFSVG